MPLLWAPWLVLAKSPEALAIEALPIEAEAPETWALPLRSPR